MHRWRRMERTAAVLIAVAILWVATARVQERSSAEEATRLNNLGVAYMNQQRFEQALGLFQQAYVVHPDLYAARLNQGIALLNLLRTEAALEILQEAVQKKPGSQRAWYNLGLLYKNKGRAEEARKAFQRVAALDPSDADTHYFLGLVQAQLQDYEKSVAAYQQALSLNPLHPSAEFGLARAYQRLGNSEQARQHLARFQQLTQAKLAAPMSSAYGDQGQYSLAEELRPAGMAGLPAIPVRFHLATAEAGLNFLDNDGVPGEETDFYEGRLAPVLGPGACFLDYDNDGHTDVYLVNSGAKPGALFRNRGKGRFEEATDAAGIKAEPGGLACTAGDYDNDGWTDLALSSWARVALYRNQGNGTFKDVTGSVFLPPSAAPASPAPNFPLGLTFLDYDHDGDLDLYVSTFPEVKRSPEGRPELSLAASAEPNQLWRNNGNGTFTDQTQAAGLAGPFPTVTAVGTDFNNDRALDLVLTGWGRAPVVLLNPREVAFRAVQPWATPMPAPTAGVAVFDFNKDGWMDLAFTHWGRPGLTLWRNLEGKRAERVALPEVDWQQGWGVATVDYDNDGWLDLVAVGEAEGKAEIRLLRNRGPEGFEDVTAKVGLDGVPLRHPRAVSAADYDEDGDPDLLVTQNGGPAQLLRNEGGNRNAWLRVALRGLGDNTSGIGTKVEVFAGVGWQKWEVQAASSYLGQSSLEVTVGLGRAQEAEIVRLLWPTGVWQDEVRLAAQARHRITEINRRGSSCPILFAWNGHRYQFITDVIGAGIVGHWVAPGRRNVPDPTEYVKVDRHQVQPKGGRLSFRLLEPMEEVVYLDQVRLLAVDHPAEVEVYPNEYFAGSPPFPAFKVIVSHQPRSPAGAWDDRGRDVLPELRERDRRYATIFELLPFKGFAQLHWLELDLGSWEASKPLRLLLHGFIDYFSATSVFAAHQAGVQPIPPYLEAQDAAGGWVRVADNIGFPAGLARTMVADLTGRLPAGTRRIRIATNLQIYWDQILVDAPPEGSAVKLREVPLVGATVAFRGYPRAVEGNPPGDLSYIYEEVSATGPYARHIGHYTRYGTVRHLVRERDDRFVVFGSGEEVGVEFALGSLPGLPAGWSRDYFFYADGFAKDMDFYEAHPETVEPLPFHGMSHYPYSAPAGYPASERHLRYQLNDNSRPVSGRGAAALRFEYRDAGKPD